MSIEVTKQVIDGQVYTVVTSKFEYDARTDAVSTELSGSNSSASTSTTSTASTTTTTPSSSTSTTSATVADGNDDGSIGFWNAAGNFFKGVGSFFKGLVCDENGDFSLEQTLKTVAAGALIAGASILIPGAGTVIALAALGYAGYHTANAVYDIATAETDADAELAWQNMGSSATEAVLAAAGARGTGAITKARSGVKTVGKGVKDLYNGAESGGFDGFKSVAEAQVSSIKAQAKNVYTGTKQNIETIASNRTARKLKRYDEKIDSNNNIANNSKMSQEAQAKAQSNANKLTQERNGYQNGVNEMGNVRGSGSTSQHRAMTKKVAEFRREMNNAKQKLNEVKDGFNKGTKTEADLTAAQNKYYEAQGKYNGAKDYLREKQIDGTVKTDDAVRSEIKTNKSKAEDALDKAKETEKTAKEAFDKDPSNKNLKTAYEKAKAQRENSQNAYDDVAYEEVLLSDNSISLSDVKYAVKESVKQGVRKNTRQNGFLTLSLEGKGYTEAA